MSPIGCPQRVVLMGYLEGQLPRLEHEAVRSHVHDCPQCQAYLEEIEPTRLFTPLAEPQTPPELWRSVWPAVQAEMRPRGLRAFLEALKPRLQWLAPATASALVAALCLGLLSHTEAPTPPVVAKSIVQDFKYLSNTEAGITHILLSDEEYGTVQLTMIVDPSFEGVF